VAFIESKQFVQFLELDTSSLSLTLSSVVKGRVSSVLRTLPFFADLHYKKIGPLVLFKEEQMAALAKLMDYVVVAQSQV
jgi:hypothetical protein